MTRDDITHMAIESGLEDWSVHGRVESKWACLERFAALVAAHERDKYEIQFKKMQNLYEIRESQPNKPCCLAEREAGAKVADKWIGCDGLSAAIRTRGNQE